MEEQYHLNYRSPTMGQDGISGGFSDDVSLDVCKAFWRCFMTPQKGWIYNGGHINWDPKAQLQPSSDIEVILRMWKVTSTTTQTSCWRMVPQPPLMATNFYV